MKIKNKEVEFHCISMIKDEGDRVIQMFKKQNIDINIFNGVNGAELDVIKTCPTSNNTVKMSNGEYGCWLSHLELIKIAKKKKLDYIFIFEEDVIISDDFKTKIDYLFSNEINFDIFYLGGAFNHITKNITKTEYQYIYNYIGAAGLHGYIVKNTLFDYIIEYPRFDYAIDGFYSKFVGSEDIIEMKKKEIPKYKMMGFMPHIVGVKTRLSTISNRITDNGMNVYFKK